MEIHQAGNRIGEQNDRSPLPSNIIIPRSWTRTELERRSLFFFFHFFQRKRESSFWIQRTKRKKKKERKNWNSYNDITRCTDVDPRELIHAPGTSRPIVHGWTRRFHKTGAEGAVGARVETRRENMACERISKCADERVVSTKREREEPVGATGWNATRKYGVWTNLQMRRV